MYGETISSDLSYLKPKLDEFYVDIPWSTTVIGAMFGSIGRQKKQIAEYWQVRQQQLDNANQQCLALSDDAEIKNCFSVVRQAEYNKTNLLSQHLQAQAQVNMVRSMYMQNAAKQFQYQRPRYTNCNTYGNMLNCSSY